MTVVRPGVVLATRNQHKVVEVQRILTAAGGPPLDLLPLDEAAPEVVETGATFAENALLKARSAAAYSGLPAIADDSGLCVDALAGMPGVFSARWAGRHGDDAANLAVLLGQLADVPDDRRGARFVCAAAVVLPAAVGGAPGARAASDPGERAHGRPVERTVEGRLDGIVIREPRGAGGFGYDPIFVPDGLDRTTAELAASDKDAISHRGRAFRALAPLLALLLGER